MFTCSVFLHHIDSENLLFLHSALNKQSHDENSANDRIRKKVAQVLAWVGLSTVRWPAYVGKVMHIKFFLECKTFVTCASSGYLRYTFWNQHSLLI